MILLGCELLQPPLIRGPNYILFYLLCQAELEQFLLRIPWAIADEQRRLQPDFPMPCNAG